MLADPKSARENDDGLVGWKSRDDVTRVLKVVLGRTISRHSLHQLFHRLKKELLRAGINPELAQSCRRRGLRFALCVRT